MVGTRLLRMCASWLSPDEVRKLRREEEPQDWSVSDLPLLYAARRRLGDLGAARRQRRRQAAVAAERARMSDVIDNVLAAEDDGEAAVTRGRLLHRRPHLPADAPRPFAVPGADAGTRMRPGRPRRPGGVGHGHRGRGRPLCRDDPGDPTTRHSHEFLTGRGSHGTADRQYRRNSDQAKQRPQRPAKNTPLRAAITLDNAASQISHPAHRPPGAADFRPYGRMSGLLQPMMRTRQP